MYIFTKKNADIEIADVFLNILLVAPFYIVCDFNENGFADYTDQISILYPAFGSNFS